MRRKRLTVLYGYGWGVAFMATFLHFQPHLDWWIPAALGAATGIGAAVLVRRS